MNKIVSYTLKPPTQERLMASALSYLDRYGTTSANLRMVLQRKTSRVCAALDLDAADYDAMIDAVVARCVTSGLLDDARYAESKIASERGKGRSSRRISAVLAAKGVPAGIAAQQIADSDVDDLSAAKILARKKRLGPWRKVPADPTRRNKEMAALCRAGFSYEIARRIVDADAIDTLD